MPRLAHLRQGEPFRRVPVHSRGLPSWARHVGGALPGTAGRRQREPSRRVAVQRGAPHPPCEGQRRGSVAGTGQRRHAEPVREVALQPSGGLPWATQRGGSRPRMDGPRQGDPSRQVAVQRVVIGVQAPAARGRGLAPRAGHPGRSRNDGGRWQRAPGRCGISCDQVQCTWEVQCTDGHPDGGGGSDHHPLGGAVHLGGAMHQRASRRWGWVRSSPPSPSRGASTYRDCSRSGSARRACGRRGGRAAPRAGSSWRTR